MSDDRDENKPSDGELAKGASLADALSGKVAPSADSEEAELVELADSLRAAHAPRDLEESVHDEIVKAALSKRGIARPNKAETRGRVIRITFGVTTTLALAAAILFFITRPRPNEDDATAALIRSRSTTPLFSAPFKPGDGAARIDRIALARERDYRENRFRPTPGGDREVRRRTR